jgi:hypothetical protein
VRVIEEKPRMLLPPAKEEIVDRHTAGHRATVDVFERNGRRVARRTECEFHANPWSRFHASHILRILHNRAPDVFQNSIEPINLRFEELELFSVDLNPKTRRFSSDDVTRGIETFTARTISDSTGMIAIALRGCVFEREAAEAGEIRWSIKRTGPSGEDVGVMVFDGTSRLGFNVRGMRMEMPVKREGDKLVAYDEERPVMESYDILEVQKTVADDSLVNRYLKNAKKAGFHFDGGRPDVGIIEEAGRKYPVLIETYSVDVAQLDKFLMGEGIYLNGDERREIERHKKAALKALINEGLNSRSQYFRYASARDINLFGDASVIPRLQEALAREKDQNVRDALGKTIESLRNK